MESVVVLILLMVLLLFSVDGLCCSGLFWAVFEIILDSLLLLLMLLLSVDGCSRWGKVENILLKVHATDMHINTWGKVENVSLEEDHERDGAK